MEEVFPAGQDRALVLVSTIFYLQLCGSQFLMKIMAVLGLIQRIMGFPFPPKNSYILVKE